MNELSVKELSVVDEKGVPMVKYEDIDNSFGDAREDLLVGMYPEDTVYYNIADAMVQKEYVKKGVSVEIGIDNVMACPISCYNIAHPKFEIAIGDNVKIGNHNLIGDGCVIGNNVVIDDENGIANGVKIGTNSEVGSDNYIFFNRCFGANNTIGSGNYIMGWTEDDVTVVDGNRIETVIGTGSKIGNYCNIPGTVRIGEYCIVGDNVTFEADVKVGDNCNICANATIKSGAEIPKGTVVPSDTIVTA